MKEYRLLIDYEVVQVLDRLSEDERENLVDRFIQIRNLPSRYADYPEIDSNGRTLQVHLFGRFAIKFWEDAADMHLKILRLAPADRSESNLS